MKKSRWKTSILFALSFCLFLGIMDYPFIARIINSKTQGSVAMGYQQDMERAEDEKKEQERIKAQAYNDSLTCGTGRKSVGAGEEDPEYQNALNLHGDGAMGMIEIPKIHVNLMIYHGTEEEVLQRGVGHLEGSSLPIGGESTHACISAHRGLVGKKMFTDLDELEEGDIFLIHVLDEILCYRVGKTYVVKPYEVDSLDIRQGEDLLTLITCTPYGINTHRLLVEGYRIPYTEEVTTEIEEKEAELNFRDWWWIGLSVILLVMMLVLLVRYNIKLNIKKELSENS